MSPQFEIPKHLSLTMGRDYTAEFKELQDKGSVKRGNHGEVETAVDLLLAEQKKR